MKGQFVWPACDGDRVIGRHRQAGDHCSGLLGLCSACHVQMRAGLLRSWVLCDLTRGLIRQWGPVLDQGVLPVDGRLV